VLDEKSGNFVAEGHVNTSRMPDQQKKPDQQQKKGDSAMLSSDDPLQAVAGKMASSNHNKLVKYDGQAVLWQGTNRIQADHVEIDREKRSILADGHVVTQSREEQKKDDPQPAPANPAPPVFTLVKAPHMIYTDQDRLAHYSGGVLLDRAGLRMKAVDLRSWLAEEGADNRLQKAFADGSVEIVQTGPIRTRIGTSEHAEYYTDDDKIVLRGGDPHMNDSIRGDTRGAELIYYSDDDRLLVNGSPAKPAMSHIRRKHQ
jgi:lipopolysaccharide export system protein LptA